MDSTRSASRSSAPQIDFDHARVVLHVVDAALGQHAALVQHGDAGGRGRGRTPGRAPPPPRCAAPAMRRSRAAVCSVSWSVMPATGSSTSSSSGSCISSMPISSHCRWPWREDGGAVLRAGGRGRSRPASPRCGAAPRRSAPSAGRRRGRAAPSGRAPGSRTRSARRTPSASGTCGRCRGWRWRPRPAGSGRGRGSGPSPAVGRVLPVMTSIIVVLPAPFGPMTARSSPGSTMRERLFSARKPSKTTETPSR